MTVATWLLHYLRYRVFCFNCDWSARSINDTVLWDALRRCPKCGGFTDAVRLY